MTIPNPATRTAWSEDLNPSRYEYRARARFTIYAISIAAHVASLGFEVQRAQHGNRAVWSAPIAAKRAADRYIVTLRALSRALEPQQVTHHAAR